ncbi:SdpA family antimicrobial peptide system protein [Deinococcus indicus]|uniref:SdpA family antimicrobial peptide system protein n=1 Tax=Deinococcus TaxID=1298 RepID=UPI00155832F7|nr:SdpA family antimicrobial peptide system protein [Deinococcus indicus]MCD0168164.1 SdpA family antimicrobial peptide system protein [Deinococcus sp. 23YEL01]
MALTYIFDANQGVNGLSLPGEEILRPYLRQNVPQGWGFFTKSPRDEDFYFYRAEGNQFVEVTIGPAGRADQFFGLDRHSRAQGIEAGLIFESTEKLKWANCTQVLSDCLKPSPSGSLVRVQNKLPNPTLCGHLAVEMRKPVPWAWAKAGTTSSSQDRRVKQFFVKC